MMRWDPPVELTAHEERLLKRLQRVRPLFGFLRRHRHELFDDAFQAKLEEVYRDTGAGECFVTLTRTARISASQAGACRGKRIWGDR